MSPETKYCSSCRTTKPLTEFGYNKGTKDGRTRCCKACNNAVAAARRRRRGVLSGPYRWWERPLPETRVCTRCRMRKPLLDFEERSDGRGLYGRKSRCRTCEQDRKAGYIDSYRWRCLVHYSQDPPSCACCDETTFEFLCIDHINGGGSKQAREIGGGKIYRWLINNGYPLGFRVLCHNCNLSLGYYHYCPHQAAGTSRLPTAEALPDSGADAG